MKKLIALSLSDVVFIMLINVKMPTIVGILTFMSRINFMLSWVEHEQSFITSGQERQNVGPDLHLNLLTVIDSVPELIEKFNFENIQMKTKDEKLLSMQRVK